MHGSCVIYPRHVGHKLKLSPDKYMFGPSEAHLVLKEA